MSKAARNLQDLWHEMKQEGNCTDYVSEMCTQLEILGTESNTLTKDMIKNKLENVIAKINATL